jgi:ribonuclease HI
MCGDHRREIAGTAIGKNNVMELTALEEGLKAIKITAAHIEVVTDSINLIGWMFGSDTLCRQPDNAKPFKRKEMQIRAVCERIDALVRDRGFILGFTWIKGHAGHPENERCDHLARAARDLRDLLQ